MSTGIRIVLCSSNIHLTKGDVSGILKELNDYLLFGGLTSGKTVTERSAIQMTAVYSCVRILAEAAAGLPLNLYRYTEGGGKEKAIDHPLYLLLHGKPKPGMSSFVFRATFMTNLLLWETPYAQIIRNVKLCTILDCRLEDIAKYIPGLDNNEIPVP